MKRRKKSVMNSASIRMRRRNKVPGSSPAPTQGRSEPVLGWGTSMYMGQFGWSIVRTRGGGGMGSRVGSEGKRDPSRGRDDVVGWNDRRWVLGHDISCPYGS